MKIYFSNNLKKLRRDILYMQNQKEFIFRLKSLMKVNGDNTVTLSKKIGAKSQSVSYWLSGQRIPKITFLENIADCYGVSIDYLVGRAEY